MIDLEKLFEYAPEGADSLKQEISNNGNLQWFKGLSVYLGDGKYANTISLRWKTIATRPQTKTVADAYEWHVRIYGTSEWRGVADCININPSNGEFTFGYKSGKTICTGEQFEAYAKEQEAKQEEEKWTHYYTDDVGEEIRCKLLAEYGEWAWVQDAGTIDTIKKSWLKPIKPKLTKAQAWDWLMERKINSVEVNTLKQYYDITD